jgi:uncharacterized membrane protein
VDPFLIALTLLAALGSGLIGGVFFAFSTFVMKALATRPPHEGMAAMQAINVVVLNPLFLIPFVGMAFMSVALIVLALFRLPDANAILMVAGGLLYGVGTFLVTLVFNVPKNNTLAIVIPTDSKATAVWANYIRYWTRWNHVRTLAALAAALAFSLAMIA